MSTQGDYQLLEGKFENWEQLSDSLFVVKKGYWGILNIHSNRFVFPCIYDQFSSSNGIFLLSQKDVWGNGDIDENGEACPPKYDSLSFQDDYCLARRGSSTPFQNDYPVYDLYDYTGELLLGGFDQFKYIKEFDLFVFLFGARYVYEHEDARYPTFDASWGRYVITDKDLSAVLPLENGSRYQFSKGQKVRLSSSLVRKNNSFKKELVYDANFPIEISLRNSPSFYNGFILTRGAGESRAIRISDGKATANFDAIRGIEGELFFVLQNKKVGIIDKEGSSIIPIEYDIMTYPVNGYYLGFKFSVSYNWISAPYTKNPNSMFRRVFSSQNECKVFLIHDIEKQPTIQLVFSQIVARDCVLMDIADGYYLFHPLENEVGLKSLSVSKLSVFNEDFAAKISITPQADSPEAQHVQNPTRVLGRTKKKKSQPIYWFPSGAVCPDREYYIQRLCQQEMDNDIKGRDPSSNERHYIEFQGTRAQEEGGYSDEEIYDIFDGNPDAYGNIE